MGLSLGTYTSRERMVSAPTIARDLTARNTYPHGEDMPLGYVSLHPNGVGYQDIEPGDGLDGPVAATVAGTWAKLYAAGRRL